MTSPKAGNRRPDMLDLAKPKRDKRHSKPMLTHLYIREFTVIESLSLDFHDGLTVVTGETGAGKSVLMNALSLAAGSRTDAAVVRCGAASADITATFSIEQLPVAARWLAAYQFGVEEACLLRRVITKDGRSRAFINGIPATVTQLKEIGGMLVDLQQQQAHQNLVRPRAQMDILDAFGDHLQLRSEVERLYHQLDTTKQELAVLAGDLSGEKESRLELLAYQLAELDQLALEPSELAALDIEHKALSHAHSNSQAAASALQELAEKEHSASDLIQRHYRQLEQVQGGDDSLAAAIGLLAESAANLAEASRELEHYFDAITEDPARLQELDTQLTQMYDVARKHKVKTEDLGALKERIYEETQRLEQADTIAVRLQERLAKLQDDYKEKAHRLRAKRISTAKKLSKAIDAYLPDLGMAGGKFVAKVAADDQQSATGMDAVSFLVAGGAGQRLGALNKVASGGELSRVSLAVHLAIVKACPSPTMVFDETDAGIGGRTAEKVGHLLRCLAGHVQVICVTHLPQVAVYGEHHLHVEKHSGDNVAVSLKLLPQADRTTEIARMLDGKNLTKRNLAHAAEMLQRAC